jgi:hypothetical protein
VLAADARRVARSNLQLLVRGDQELVPAVCRAHAQHDLAAAANDLGGDVHEGLPKPLPFPAHDLRGQRELGDPLAEVPGEPRDLEPGAVAVELGDRHAPRGEARAELLDHVLLVAAFVGQVDHVLGRDRGRQARHDVAVAVLLEEEALALVMLDELTADHQAIRLTGRVDLLDLGQPLLDELLLLEVARASSLAAAVWLLAARGERWVLATLEALAMGPRPKRLPPSFVDRLDELGAVRELSTDEREVGAGAVARCAHVAAIEVAIAAHEQLAAALPGAWQDRVEHVGRAVRGPDVAGAVADREALAGPRERDDQRLVAPGALVELGALLLDAIERFDVPVDVDDRPRFGALAAAAPKPPPDLGLCVASAGT